LNKLNRELQGARSADRKRDAHEKILLGGLVVKAGLRDEDKAVILGLLVEAAERLGDMHVREHYRLRGKAIFDNDRQTRATAGSAGDDDDRGVSRPYRD